MKKLLTSLTLGLSLLTLCATTSAQTDAKTAKALMQNSGIWQQLTAISPQIQSGLLASASQAGVKPSLLEIERLSKTVDEIYSSDRLRSTALATFKAHTKAAHIPALRRWYASDIGKTITGVEEAAVATQANPQTTLEQGTALLAEMPADRRTVLENIIVASRSAQAITQITVDTTLATQRGVLSVTPNPPSNCEGDLRSMLEAQRPQMLEAFGKLALANAAIMYAELPTVALTQYVEFLSSAPGQHFSDVALKAYSAALVKGAEELGRKLPVTKMQGQTLEAKPAQV